MAAPDWENDDKFPYNYQIGKILGTIESIETKVEYNNKAIVSLKDCFDNNNVVTKKEIDDTKTDINKRLDSIQEQLSLYATIIKASKVVFFIVVFVITLRIGDIKSLLSGFFK